MHGVRQRAVVHSRSRRLLFSALARALGVNRRSVDARRRRGPATASQSRRRRRARCGGGGALSQLSERADTIIHSNSKSASAY